MFGREEQRERVLGANIANGNNGKVRSRSGLGFRLRWCARGCDGVRRACDWSAKDLRSECEERREGFI
ncbi:hypothetical protein ACSQ67_008538 [Phaseolus vulgaris]